MFTINRYKVSSAMKAKGFTEKDLAARADLPVAFVEEVITGEARTRDLTPLLKLGAALGENPFLLIQNQAAF